MVKRCVFYDEVKAGHSVKKSFMFELWKLPKEDGGGKARFRFRGLNRVETQAAHVDFSVD
jgi:hypothetical protein